jgi:hypothetical protein
MRVATIAGRATVLTDAGALDVEKASQGRFPAGPGDLFGSRASAPSARTWSPRAEPMAVHSLNQTVYT